MKEDPDLDAFFWTGLLVMIGLTIAAMLALAGCTGRHMDRQAAAAQEQNKDPNKHRVYLNHL